MESTKRLFIVSFGNSRDYRYEVEDSYREDDLRHGNPLESVEEQVKEYLANKFPDQPLAYYRTPKVTEVRWDDREKYADYPELNSEALADIEKELVREIKVRDDGAELDSDAPYSDIKLT